MTKKMGVDSSILHVSAWNLDEKDRTEPILLDIVCALAGMQTIPGSIGEFWPTKWLGRVSACR